MLRPIAPADRQLLVASFERLSEDSRYRRFFTAKDHLSETELDYLVNVDHRNHEAIVAIDPSGGMLVGVARYFRSRDDAERAELAVVVADDWQRRGVGRALLDRLTYRARCEGVRRFTALVQRDNRASLGLLASLGEIHRRFEMGMVEIVLELPPKRGTGARLGLALRTVADGGLVPAKTLAHGVAVEVDASSRSSVGRPAKASGRSQSSRPGDVPLT